MSVVLVGPSGSLGRAVFARLCGQGDDIRVIESERAAAEKWKQEGAFVALARDWDADLIERASREARTLVVFPQEDRAEGPLLEEIVRGAYAASVERIVVLRAEAALPPQLAATSIGHVVLALGRRSLLRRAKRVSDELVAEAVDAADDLEGTPRFVVDLTKIEEHRRLKI